MGRKLITMPDLLLTSLREYEKDHPEFNFSGFVQKQTAEMLRTNNREVINHDNPSPAK